MTLLAVNDVLRIVVYTKFNPQPQYGLNIHYYKITAVVGAPDETTVAGPYYTFIQPYYCAVMSAQAQIDGVTVQRFMPPLPMLEPTPSAGFANTGLIAGDPLPPDKAGIITWKTGKAGKKYRGRSYVPFPGEADNGVDGLPTAGYVTALTTLANKLMSLTAIGSVGNTVSMTKCIVHGRVPGSPNDLVTYNQPRSKWADQHRRGDYGRPNFGGPFS